MTIKDPSGQTEETGITRAERCAELKADNIAELSNATIASRLQYTGKALERFALHDDKYHKSVFASSQWGIFGELIMKMPQPLPEVSKPSIEGNFNAVSVKPAISVPDPLLPSGPKFPMPGPGGSNT